jgi:hypothetical protein
VNAQQKALAATAIANQGKITWRASSGLTDGKKPTVSPLSMVRRRVTPRGAVIHAGRAFF